MSMPPPKAAEPTGKACEVCCGPYAMPQLHAGKIQVVCDLCTGTVTPAEHIAWIQRLVDAGLPVPAHAVKWLLQRLPTPPGGEL